MLIIALDLLHDASCRHPVFYWIFLSQCMLHFGKILQNEMATTPIQTLLTTNKSFLVTVLK